MCTAETGALHLRTVAYDALRPAVVVHQPHFLPWLGYYNKLANANAFVVQDNVQFRRRYFQNRSIIRDPQGRPHWLTIPVHAHRATLIRDVTVATSRWASDARRALRHAYGSARYFREYWDTVASCLNENDKYLVDINQAALGATLALLGISVPVHRMSALASAAVDPTANIIAACSRLSARSYIFGEGGGRFRHSASSIEDAGITVVYQQFKEPYQQRSSGLGLTVFNVSVVECLFVLGADQTRDLVEIWRLGEAL